MILKRFPVEYQMDSQDCGPASLKMIAKHFGRFSLQTLRDRCSQSKNCISLLDLSVGAESIGLRTLAIKATIKQLAEEVPLPAIIFWNDNHYIVVYHSTKKYIYVSDPTKGLIKYAHDEFCRGWYVEGESQGVLLAVEQTADFRKT